MSSGLVLTEQAGPAGSRLHLHPAVRGQEPGRQPGAPASSVSPRAAGGPVPDASLILTQFLALAFITGLLASVPKGIIHVFLL